MGIGVLGVRVVLSEMYLARSVQAGRCLGQGLGQFGVHCG